MLTSKGKQKVKGVSNYLLIKATLPQASHDDAHLTSPESLFLPTFTQAITNKKNKIILIENLMLTGPSNVANQASQNVFLTDSA